MSLFFFGFFCLNIYAWWVATLVVGDGWTNYGFNNYGEPFRFSNIFISFQAIQFAMFTIPSILPLLEPVIRGLVFAKLVFDLIERTPVIRSEDDCKE